MLEAFMVGGIEEGRHGQSRAAKAKLMRKAFADGHPTNAQP